MRNNKEGAFLFLLFIIIYFISLKEIPDGVQFTKPNIIIIMADDMGFDDVSFRGSNKFLTPNIDALAYSGVIINNLYTPAMCTPSRAALLTGKYPINTGMQHYVIVNDQPWGLPLNETTMAQIFQENGYHTNLLGKWHLGMHKRSYTPTKRGFHHHLGYLGAYVDYYSQTYFQESKSYAPGHDFRKDLEVSHDYLGHYVTDVLTDAAVHLIERHNASSQPLFLLLSHLAPHAANADDPMQAPIEELAQFKYISNKTERFYAAMVSRLDKSVGRVIDALTRQNLLNDSIIIFLSDNGGPTVGEHSTTASNYPLRGQKNSPWEGGIRSSAAIWSRQLSHPSRVWNQSFYIGDLLPTLASAARIKLNESLKLDGLDFWSSIKNNDERQEREIVHNIDNLEPYFSYTYGKWKIVSGTTNSGLYDGWLADGFVNETDPRAANYEQVIKETNVWQQLRGDLPVINISSLRDQAQIECKEPDENDQPCRPLLAPCVFDIEADPCENNNMYELLRDDSTIKDMFQRIKLLDKNARQPENKPADPNCDPANYNNEWTWWQDESSANLSKSPIFLYILIAILGFILFK